MPRAGQFCHFAGGKTEEEGTSPRLRNRREPVAASSAVLRPRGALFTGKLRAGIFHLTVCVPKSPKSFMGEQVVEAASPVHYRDTSVSS